MTARGPGKHPGPFCLAHQRIVQRLSRNTLTSGRRSTGFLAANRGCWEFSEPSIVPLGRGYNCPALHSIGDISDLQYQHIALFHNCLEDICSRFASSQIFPKRISIFCNSGLRRISNIFSAKKSCIKNSIKAVLRRSITSDGIDKGDALSVAATGNQTRLTHGDTHDERIETENP